MIISDGINKTEKYDETQEYFFSCRAMFRWLYEKGILKKNIISLQGRKR